MGRTIAPVIYYENVEWCFNMYINPLVLFKY